MATRNSFYHHALDTYGFSKDPSKSVLRTLGGKDGSRISASFAGDNNIRLFGVDTTQSVFDTGLMKLTDLELDVLLRVLVRNHLS